MQRYQTQDSEDQIQLIYYSKSEVPNVSQLNKTGFSSFKKMMTENNEETDRINKIVKQKESSPKIQRKNMQPKMNEINSRLQFNQQQLSNIIFHEKNQENSTFQCIIKTYSHNQMMAKTMTKLVKIKDRVSFPSSLNDQQKKKELMKQKAKTIGTKLEQLSWAKQPKVEFLQVEEEVYQAILNYPVFVYEIEDESNINPETREGARTIYIKGVLYLYGGVGVDVFNSFWKYDFVNYKWQKLGLIGEYPSLGRYQFSMVKYKNKIYIFGGEWKFNKAFKIRECFNDIYSIDPDTESFSLLRCSGDMIEARRNHSANIIGKFMFVIGGINSNSKLLNSIVCLNMETLKWNILQQTGFQALAYHCSSVVFKGDVKLDHPYYNYSVKPYQKLAKVEFDEGIYVFGGEIGISKDGKTNDEINEQEQNLEKSIYEDICILTIGTKPIVYRQLQTFGRKPIRRMNSTMHFDGVSCFLFIIGGRTLFNSLETQLNCNLYAFNLQTKTWTNIITIGCEFKQRYSHCSTLVENKIIIFGGQGEGQFASSNITFIEIDQKNLKTILHQNKCEKLVVYSELLMGSSNEKMQQKYLDLIENEKKKVQGKGKVQQSFLLENINYQINNKYQRQLKERLNVHEGQEGEQQTEGEQNIKSYMPMPIRKQRLTLKVDAMKELMKKCVQFEDE